MNKKIILFDCDETIWFSKDKDYISSVISDFSRLDESVILRNKDSKMFILRKGVLNGFNNLKQMGDKIVVGIVSDNNSKVVLEALKLFKLWSVINPKAVNIKLWDGYCPKHEMVMHILNKKEFCKIQHKQVFWFDDKDYSEEAREIGVNFIRIEDKDDLSRVLLKTKLVLNS